MPQLNPRTISIVLFLLGLSSRSVSGDCPSAPTAYENTSVSHAVQYLVTVPTDCSYIRIHAWAGGGGSGRNLNWAYHTGDGGGGAAFFGSAAATPGTQFRIGIGRQAFDGGGGYGLAVSRCVDPPACGTYAVEVALGSGGAGGKVRINGFNVLQWPHAGAGGVIGEHGQDALLLWVVPDPDELHGIPSGKGAVVGGPGVGGSEPGNVYINPGGNGGPNPMDANPNPNGGVGAYGQGGEGGTGQYGGGGGASWGPPGNPAFEGAAGGGGSSWTSWSGQFLPGHRKAPGNELSGYRVGLDPNAGGSCETVGGAGCGGLGGTGIANNGGVGRVVVEFSATPFAGRGDIDGDGQTDLIIRNGVTVAPPSGTWEHRFWLMNGVNRLSEVTLSPGNTLDLSGEDDFNGDGKQDLVFRNTSTGEIVFWLMNGTSKVSEVTVLGETLDWKLSATGDFDHNAKPDIVWHNNITQKIRIWTMNGTVHTGDITPIPDQALAANWTIVGAVDLNADANTDFLWYNSTSGKIVYWWMDWNVARITGAFTVPPNAGANNWKVLALGDYGIGDGGVAQSADIVWRNETSGNFVVWYMDFAGNRTGGVLTNPTSPSPNPTEWTIVGPR